MRKTGIVRAFLIVLLSCGLIFALSACSTNCTVSYSLGEHAADDAIVPESAEYAQGAQITLPTAPTAEEGWQFIAWFDGEQTYGAGASYVVEDNVTFTATWEEASPEPVSYTVTYALGGHAADGAEVPVAQTVEAGTEITLPAAPEAAENWAFDGWNDGEQIYTAGTSYTVESNVTFTAVWKDMTPAPETYTVTFDANGATGGSVPEAMAGNLSGAQIDLPANTGDLTREGYTYAGWSETSGGAAINGKYTVTGDVTLYAVWTAKQFTVVLDYNYEDAEDGAVSVTFGSTFGAASGWIETPVRTGYEFLGWFENADGTGTRYAGSTQITAELAQGFTLYAKWERTTYAVTFDANGGTVGGAETKEIRVEENGTVSVDAVGTPERSGYRFEGWYHGDTALVFGETKITADITFTARWTQVWTVTVGGDSVATLAEGEAYTLAVPEAVSGQTFMGWTSGGTLVYTAENRIVTMGASDIVLAEKWAVHDGIAAEDEFLAVLADEAATAITLRDSFGVHQAVSVDRTLTIDLNGEKLTFVTAENAGPSGVASLHIAEEGGNLTINGGENGAIVFDVAYTGVTYRDAFSGGIASMNGTFSPLSVWGTLTLNNVDVASTTSAVVVARGTLNMTGGSIVADGTYGIGTNATAFEGQPLYGGVTISLENVTIAAEKGYFDPTWTNDSAAVLINVPGTLTMENVTATGARQGVVVRGGTATIENSTIVSLGTCTDKSYLEENWGSGSNLPHAALVVGDRSGGYAYPAEVTLGTGNTFTGNNEALEIYAYADKNTSASIRGTGYCDLITVGNGSEAVAIEHSFTETPVYNAETGMVEVGCSLCGIIQSYEIKGISIDANPDQIAVAGIEIGTEVSLTGFTVTARGDWGDSADVTIPVTDGRLEGVISGNAYKSGEVTITFTADYGSVKGVASGIEFFRTIAGGKAEAGNYSPRLIELGTFAGEFELSYTMSDIARGSATWNSWTLNFASNGYEIVIREDNYQLNNYGRGNSQFIGDVGAGVSATLQGFTDTGSAFYNEFRDSTDPIRVLISRSDRNGSYTMTIVLTQGTKIAKFKIEEPVLGTANEMTVWIGADTANYVYSDVVCVEEELILSGIQAIDPDITVNVGTSLEAALSKARIVANYAGSTVSDAVTAYEIIDDGEYDPNAENTYTVTVGYQGKSATVRITVDQKVLPEELTLLKNYVVSDNKFTDNSEFVSAIGTVDYGGFKASEALATPGNPLAGQSLNGGFTIHLELYVHAATLWAPILSISEGTGENDGFLSVVVGTTGVQVSYNKNGYFDASSSMMPDFNSVIDITVSLSGSGTLKIYVDGVDRTPNGMENSQTVLTCYNEITASDSSYGALYFFGGNRYWPNLFDGYIQSCAIYNGVVSAEDAPNL